MTRKEAPEKRWMVFCALACAVLLLGSADAWQSPRFQGPLGLDKMLTGTVVKAKLAADSPKDAARYLLKAEDATYQLHGHEKELRKLVGKKARVSGNAVGENLTVDSVERLQEK